jgi:hypothetical protein
MFRAKRFGVRVAQPPLSKTQNNASCMFSAKPLTAMAKRTLRWRWCVRHEDAGLPVDGASRVIFVLTESTKKQMV